MIVLCTNCRAKFRVPDEKVGPRGAKVRCSRCSTVFLVRPEGIPATEGPPSLPSAEGGPLEAPRGTLDVDLEPGSAAPAPFGMSDPFSTGALALSVTETAPLESAQESDAPLRAVPPPLPGTSPPSAPVVRADDPFAGFGYALGTPPAPEAFDAGGQTSDPNAPQVSGHAEESLPLTDLSDLLGAEPPEIPCPDPHGASEPPAGLAPDEGGLSLEERLTPPPVSLGGTTHDPFAESDTSLPGLDAAPPAFATSAATDAFASGSSPFLPAYEGEPLPGEEALALAGESAEPQPAEGYAEPPPPAPSPPEEAARERGPAERVPRRRVPLRSIAANAVALAALLAIALAMLAVWRSEGPFEIRMLRPSALVAALRTGGPPPPFAAIDLRSGVYERERGSPILFVRGRLVSRAPEPVRSVRVAVEVMRGGQVIARGAALAGAVPTPEELWTAPDDSALENVARVASARMPPLVRPGDRVPFLVAIADHPADLDGATLRLDFSPAKGDEP